MADNFGVDVGTSGNQRTIATDQIGSVDYQRVKVVWGTDGTATDASVTNPLPVVVGAGSSAIGSVSVSAVPADPFGANADAASATGSISAKLRYLAATGLAGMTSLPAGSNSIGTVVLGAGSASVGTVVLGAGSASVGTVVLGAGSASVGTVIAGAGEAHVGEVAGRIATVSAEFTRPSDTTAYAAGDVVSNSTSSTTLLSISGCARVNAGSGYIVGATVVTNTKSLTPRIRVHVFNASNPTVSVDNSALQEKYADISKRLGYFDMPAMTTGTDTTNSDMSRAVNFSLRFPFVCAASSTTLYFLFETLDAFTPTSGEKFTLVVNVDQN